MFPGSPTHRTAQGIVVALSQMLGLDTTSGQASPIETIAGALSTSRGLYNVPGTHYIYYVRDSDVADNSLPFAPGSQGKVKKIATFPTNVTESSTIRSTVFSYQNNTFATSVTSIEEYEEAASFYMTGGVLSYDPNSTTQNKIVPNT